MAEGQRLFHRNAFGFARLCACAVAVHLHFGNIALLLRSSQLHDFSASVSETIMKDSAAEDKDERCIYLPTRDMALTYKELLLLDEILNESILMVQIDKLLSN